MKSVIIFHSHSGITRGVAEKIGERLGGDMIEVTPEKEYSRLTQYLLLQKIFVM